MLYNTKGFIKIDGDLKLVKNIWVKASGAYKRALSIFERQAGAWKEIHVVNELIESGIVIAWDGAISELPEGWALCDGQNGTPDLRGRFILGGTASGEAGGSNVHEHIVCEVAHSHTTDSGTHRHIEWRNISYQTSRINPGYASTYDGAHTHTISENSTHDHGGVTEANNIPPYYKLCYIMKL